MIKIGILLAAMLILLKITGFVLWPWWIVLAPVWLPLLGWLLFMAAVIALAALTGVL